MAFFGQLPTPNAQQTPATFEDLIKELNGTGSAGNALQLNNLLTAAAQSQLFDTRLSGKQTDALSGIAKNRVARGLRGKAVEGSVDIARSGFLTANRNIALDALTQSIGARVQRPEDFTLESAFPNFGLNERGQFDEFTAGRQRAEFETQQGQRSLAVQGYNQFRQFAEAFQLNTSAEKGFVSSSDLIKRQSADQLSRLQAAAQSILSGEKRITDFQGDDFLFSSLGGSDLKRIAPTDEQATELALSRLSAKQRADYNAAVKKGGSVAPPGFEAAQKELQDRAVRLEGFENKQRLDFIGQLARDPSQARGFQDIATGSFMDSSPRALTALLAGDADFGLNAPTGQDALQLQAFNRDLFAGIDSDKERRTSQSNVRNNNAGFTGTLRALSEFGGNSFAQFRDMFLSSF